MNNKIIILAISVLAIQINSFAMDEKAAQENLLRRIKAVLLEKSEGPNGDIHQFDSENLAGIIDTQLDGETLLHTAIRCKYGHGRVWVLGKNPDVNARNAYNMTPLMVAANVCDDGAAHGLAHSPDVDLLAEGGPTNITARTYAEKRFTGARDVLKEYENSCCRIFYRSKINALKIETWAADQIRSTLREREKALKKQQ